MVRRGFICTLLVVVCAITLTEGKLFHSLNVNGGVIPAAYANPSSNVTESTTQGLTAAVESFDGSSTIVVGNVPGNNTDAYVASYSYATGQILWEKTIGGAGIDVFTDIDRTSDQGYIISGYTSSFGQGQLDAWLVKLDANGNQLWAKTYGTSANEQFRAVKVLSDGTIALGGAVQQPGAPQAESLIARLDANGTMLWSRTFSSTEQLVYYDLLQLPNGDIAAVGQSAGTGAQVGEKAEFRLSDGTSVYQKMASSQNGNGFFGLTRTANGMNVAVGSLPDPTCGDAVNKKKDMMIVKYDDNGDNIEGLAIGTASCDHDEWANEVITDSDGNFVVAGTDLAQHEAIILKLDQNLGVLREYYVPGLSTLSDVYQAGNGNYVFVGATTGGDTAVVITDSNLAHSHRRSAGAELLLLAPFSRECEFQYL